jgi:D-alanyl-D-alanine carboxypeptidase
MRKLTKGEYQLSFSVAILIVLFAVTWGSVVKKNMEQEALVRKNERAITATRVFIDTTLSAKAIYIYDATDEVALYSLNEDHPLPLASLTKVMTALVVKSAIPETEKITISANALSESGDSGFHVNDTWRTADLVRLMLVSSSNDAATAIREHLDGRFGAGEFISRMNKMARTIGLAHTTFYNESGLDIGTTPGAVGTAKDVATLFSVALRDIPDIMTVTTKPDVEFFSSTGIATHVENTNNITTSVDELLASKTGYTSIAGGNLGFAFRVPVYGHTIIAVVLGSTREARFTDMKFLIDATNSYFEQTQKD